RPPFRPRQAIASGHGMSTRAFRAFGRERLKNDDFIKIPCGPWTHRLRYKTNKPHRGTLEPSRLSIPQASSGVEFACSFFLFLSSKETVVYRLSHKRMAFTL